MHVGLSKGITILQLALLIAFVSVSQGKESNFDKFGHDEIQHLGEPYDYGSIMHYGAKSFTRNGRSTIVALKTGANQMGQRKGFSANDIRQINKLYKCPKSKLHLRGEVRGFFLNAILLHHCPVNSLRLMLALVCTGGTRKVFITF